MAGQDSNRKKSTGNSKGNSSPAKAKKRKAAGRNGSKNGANEGNGFAAMHDEHSDEERFLDGKEKDPSMKAMKATEDDRWSIMILLVLYTLQGIPMGLCGSIPLIMKERGVSYEGLSLFSLVSMPFSLKLLWAPLVDSCYFPAVGRRKTWLVPVQLLTGLVMILGSVSVATWIGDDDGSLNVNVKSMFYFFMFLYFLMATQDIAVDGWALTMLSRENVGYASLCNSIGQSFGVFISNQGFIALSDPIWCRRFWGISDGSALVSLPAFLQFWGWVFVVTTVVVWVGKTETPIAPGEEPEGLIDTYKQVGQMLRLRPVQLLCLVLLTCRVAFGPADAVSTYKMQEYGMPKADITAISPLIMLVGFILPPMLSKYVPTKPLYIFVGGMGLKLFTSLLRWLVVVVTPHFYMHEDVSIWASTTFYGKLTATFLLHEIAGTSMFLGMMSFFAKISDPSIGGTYMTLLNTISNLGSIWPGSTALYILPRLTVATCHKEGITTAIESFHCNTKEAKDQCFQEGGTCNLRLDGYTVETMGALCIGVLWLLYMKKYILQMQNLHYSEWRLSSLNSQSRKA